MVVKFGTTFTYYGRDYLVIYVFNENRMCKAVNVETGEVVQLPVELVRIYARAH